MAFIGAPWPNALNLPVLPTFPIVAPQHCHVCTCQTSDGEHLRSPRPTYIVSSNFTRIIWLWPIHWLIWTRCKRCQKRKVRSREAGPLFHAPPPRGCELTDFSVQIKCTRTYPCSSCSAANVRCEFREDDFKRLPVSREYIAALESRVATLEAVIGRLKGVSHEERDDILDGITLQDRTQPFAPDTAADSDTDEIALSDALRKATLHETDEGMLIIRAILARWDNI